MPTELSWVGPCCHSPISVSWTSSTGSRVVSGSTISGPGATELLLDAAFWSRSSVGRTPVASVTTAPLATSAATTTPAPTTVCIRRRAAPARRMIVTRGQMTSVVAAARAANAIGIDAAGMFFWVANWAAAVCSSRSATSPGIPISRAMSSIDTAASWVSNSAWRWLADRAASASRVARLSASSRFSRCHGRTVDRRTACRHACGRTADSGSSSREVFRQWCHATTNASRTALRAAPRSPVSA